MDTTFTRIAYEAKSLICEAAVHCRHHTVLCILNVHISTINYNGRVNGRMCAEEGERQRKL